MKTHEGGLSDIQDRYAFGILQFEIQIRPGSVSPCQ